MKKELNKLFYPKSIAIVGASRTPGKLGFDILSNLIEHGYKGDLYPINPNADKILGLKVYKDISEVKGNIDMALITIPAEIVLESIIKCIKKGIKNFIVISAGFKEGGEEGKIRESKLIEIINKYNINLIGPNCLGIINTACDMNASFAEGMPEKGNIGLISQSGAIAVAINDWAGQKKVGFSKIISVGNKTGLDENDYLEYLNEDENTKVILIYLENFSNGKKFIEIASKISMKKPIILFKSGTSEKGIKAVFSHTGSLAGSDNIVDVALKKSGVIRAESVEDLFDFAKAFNIGNLPKDNKIGIITNAGGMGVISTDLIEKSDILEINEFGLKTQKLLSKFLPPTANTKNPVDIIGDALSDRYENSIKTVLENEKLDFLYVLLTPQVMTQKEDTAKCVINFNKQFKNVIFFTSFVGGKNIEFATEKLEESGVANYTYPNRAVLSMEKMVELSNWRKNNLNKKTFFKINNDKVKKEIVKKIIKLKKSGINQIPQDLTNEILKYSKIPFSECMEVSNEKDLIINSKKIGYPIVLKIISEKATHKSDIGGVILGIKNEEELISGYNKLLKIAKSKIGGKNNFKIIIQKMAQSGSEFIIGMKKDPNFGQIIMLGVGGIFVEVIKDISFKIAPVSTEESLKMISELKYSKVIKGIRGKKPLDSEIISNVICAISTISIDFPEIEEIDINPLIVHEKGKKGIVVDARIKI